MALKYIDLEFAFESTAASNPMCERIAYISKTTGEIYYSGDEEFMDEEELPEDLWDNDEYVALPDKYELDLGKELVWAFVRQEIPGLYDKVREIFSRRGAYARWKDFLDYNGLLQKWYDFENERTRAALLKWCEENGIKVVDN